MPAELSNQELPDEVKAAAQLPRSRIGDYIRVTRLGSGAMSDVWKAWDLPRGRWVALKFLKYNDANDAERFAAEARTTARLSHPGIGAIYDATEDYIAMQYVPGRTLATFPRNDVRQLAKIVRQAAEAVHHAHQHGRGGSTSAEVPVGQ